MDDTLREGRLDDGSPPSGEDLRGGDSSTPTRTHTAVVRYYTTCWVPRLSEGHNADSLAIHYGLHDDDTLDMQAAKRRMNDFVGDQLGLGASPEGRVIDAGCGVGGTAIHLARRFPHLRATGLNLGADQLALARRFAREAGVADRVNFVQGDYVQMPADDDAIAGVYQIESLCHSPQKDRVLAEALRVLRPGGRLVVVDFFRTPTELDGQQAEAYAAVREGFCLPDYYDLDPVEQALEAGFARAELQDTTREAMPGILSSDRRAAEKLEPGGEELTDDVRGHLLACRGLVTLIRAGRLVHGCFVAEKPTS